MSDGSPKKGLKGAPRAGSFRKKKDEAPKAGAVSSLLARFEGGGSGKSEPDPEPKVTKSSSPKKEKEEKEKEKEKEGGGGSKRVAKEEGKRGSLKGAAKPVGDTLSPNGSGEDGNKEKEGSKRRKKSPARKRSPSKGSGSGSDRKSGKRGASATRRGSSKGRGASKTRDSSRGKERGGDKSTTSAAGGGTKKEDIPPVTDTFLKAFSDSKAFVRATAISIITPADLASPKLLTLILNLLEDTSEFTVPTRQPNEDEKKLMRILRIGTLRNSKWLTVTPADKRPDEKKEGEQKYYVNDVAAKALQLMPAYKTSSKSLDTLLDAYRKSKPPHLLRQWIDRNLPKFEWENIGKAFEGFIQGALSSDHIVDPPHIDAVLRGLAEHQYKFVAKCAATRNPPSYVTLNNVFKRDLRGDLGSNAVLEAAEKAKTPMEGEGLFLVARIGAKPNFKKRVVALLKKWADAGSSLSEGYLAIWDKAGGERWKKTLESGKRPSDEQLKGVVLRVRDMKFPKEFPLGETLAAGDRDWAIRSLNRWDDLPDDRRAKALKKMVDLSKEPRHGYEALFELAKAGSLTTDRKYGPKFFEAMADAIKATDDWHLELEDWDFEGHPLVYMSKPNLRPCGWEEKIIELMKQDVVRAHVVCMALKGNKWRQWEPIGDVQVAFLEACGRELDDIEKKYSQLANPKADIHHPSESPIFNIIDRWEDLKKTVKAIGGPAEEHLTRINKIIGYPQPFLPNAASYTG